MELANALLTGTRGIDRLESVADRLEDGTDAVATASAQARRAVSGRAAAAVDRGADGRRGRSDPDETLRERVLERVADEACSRVVGRSAEELREQAETDRDATLDRALEAFLRRYRLDATRLDDQTLAAIRDRVAPEADLDPEELLERIADADGSASESNSGTEPTDPAAAVADAYGTFCETLELETDRSPNRVLEDVLDRDAVEVARALERGLEASRAVSEQTAERRGADAEPPTPPQPSLAADAAGDDPDATAGSASVATAAALAATTLLSDDLGDGQALTQLLPMLASVGASGDRFGDGVLGWRLLELFSGSLTTADAGGIDLGSLRSRSAGSKALIALFVANLVAMSIGAWVSREKAPPIPEEIRDPDGEAIVTADQIRLGKKAFQANGLMNHGSILGNGSYFGVDLTADALELKAEYVREYYAHERGVDAVEELEPDERAGVVEQAEREFDTDAPEGPFASYSAAEAYAHRRIREEYVERYYEGDPGRGVPAEFVNSADEAERIADFACWTAWMAHTDRPGSDHSYTNDWPYVPGTGNRPTGQVLVWSTISLVLLIAGGGAGAWAYHAFDFAEPATEVVDIPSPDDVSITPTQYAAAWYVPVAGALFVAQTLVGALLAHYYVERTGFYGIGDALGMDIVSLLPFSVGRTWHINLAILWITALWLAGGLFLPGLFTDSDPPLQAAATAGLLGVLVATTVGAFAGVWLSSQGAFASPDEGELWWWLGSEGLEYLEVGRLWKVLLLVGFGSWTGLVLRSVRRMDEPPTGLGHFMTYAGGSIALMFAASMLYTPETNIAVTEFWRWWVVHMWVEGVFEFFVTAVVSVALVSMELLDKGDAEKAILFEVFAIMGAGIVGVSHHYWWVGLPDIWVPIGTTFSTLEFVPLLFILYQSFGEYSALKAQGESFPYTLPLLFIIGSSVWNFVGGGVLGFFINLPVINYYEHGTYLTVAHGHAATFGAFGLLALGLGTYVMRVVTPEEAWEPTWFRGAFWLTNVGLAVMTIASLLPLGFLQLQTSYQDGYAAARSLEFYEQDHIQTLLWARTLGDTPMILGALAFTVGAVRHLLAARREHRATG
ncbi:cbb3-type cytochrome c oxidase subunit I [Natronococcus sp. A-GB7]|uniref:cbb3-type cytochrome c oxidase subunit I n=1 Tax=Natronococcus sp. A-GB7 TaxID=3037649 RepID=UPI00241DB06E|nr:cbb3-type cytochrome c oxidase subunit I [Natronococcus sp. A-GB7]MDG5820557.1 cbb3-type cytochrome c oxidase subunit I [Natronococcus sp. A-GB7]